MLRMTLLEVFLFSLPFAIFFLYRKFILRHRLAEGEAFDATPYHKLFIVGGVLALSVFLFLVFHHKIFREGEYIPAHLENGKVVRGQFVESQPIDESTEKKYKNEPANPPQPQDN